MSHRLRSASRFAVPAAFLAAVAFGLSSAAVADDAPPPVMPQPTPPAPPLPQPPTAPDGNAVPKAEPDAGPLPAPKDPAAKPQQFTMEELTKLVGPVALYPDPLLASLLPASAFPLEVVQAARFVREKGGKVDAVPEDRGWDGSVVSLLQFPDVVLWLDENLEWLERLGVAVAVQQADVLEAIQRFRREAKKAGHLKTNDKVVVAEEAPPPEAGITSPDHVICIQPAQPEVIYVPVYDPIAVCRPWPYLATPVIAWGLGYTCGPFGPWSWYDIGWGWGWGWGGHHGYAWGGGIFFHDHFGFWGHHHSHHAHHSHHSHHHAGGWHDGRAWSAPYRITRASSMAVTSLRSRSIAGPRTSLAGVTAGTGVVSRVSARAPSATGRPDRSRITRSSPGIRGPAPSVLAGSGAARVERSGSIAGSRRLGTPAASLGDRSTALRGSQSRGLGGLSRTPTRAAPQLGGTSNLGNGATTRIRSGDVGGVDRSRFRGSGHPALGPSTGSSSRARVGAAPQQLGRSQGGVERRFAPSSGSGIRAGGSWGGGSRYSSGGRSGGSGHSSMRSFGGGGGHGHSRGGGRR
jgi:hypothetical protein